MRLVIKFALVVYIVVFATSAYAGWEIVDTEGGFTLISGAYLKTVPAKDDTMIFDAGTKTITYVNRNQGKYATGKPEAYCDAMGKMQKESMEGITPEQKEAMEQYRKDLSKKKAVKVSAAGSGGSVAGYRTIKYTVTLDGEKYEDLFVASDAPFFKEKHMDDFLEMFHSFGVCMRSQMEQAGVNLVIPAHTKEYQAVMKKGWFMKIISYDAVPYGGQPETQMEVTTVKKRSISRSELSPPKEFEKISMEEFMRLERGGGMHEDEGMGMDGPPPGYDAQSMQEMSDKLERDSRRGRDYRNERDYRHDEDARVQPDEPVKPAKADEPDEPEQSIDQIKDKALGKLKKLWGR